jgi:hypothetical protein
MWLDERVSSAGILAGLNLDGTADATAVRRIVPEVLGGGAAGLW